MAHSQNCRHRRRTRVYHIALQTCFKYSFRHSVGSLPIGSSPRQVTTFIYLNETTLQAEIGITPTRLLLIPPFQMQTFPLATSFLRSLLKAQNFLMLKSTRTTKLEGNSGGLIAHLNLYGLLWSLTLLQCVFYVKLWFESCSRLTACC